MFVCTLGVKKAPKAREGSISIARLSCFPPPFTEAAFLSGGDPIQGGAPFVLVFGWQRPNSGVVLPVYRMLGLVCIESLSLPPPPFPQAMSFRTPTSVTQAAPLSPTSLEAFPAVPCFVFLRVGLNLECNGVGLLETSRHYYRLVCAGALNILLVIQHAAVKETTA